MSSGLRAGALLAAGSLAVHQLRYLVAYGGEGSAAAGGHGYLAWVTPLIALALAAACGAWLARVGRDPGGAARPTPTWLGASAALGLTYVVQESIEGLAAPGHPGLLAHGGWVALPVVLAVGALVALLMRGFRAADRAACRAARPWSPLAATPATPSSFDLPSAAPVVPRPRVLARRLAGRAPPLPA